MHRVWTGTILAGAMLAILSLDLSLAVPDLARADDWSVKRSQPPGVRGGVVKTPESSIAKPGDAGERSHTNTKVFVPTQRPRPIHPGAAGSDQQQPPASTRSR